MKILFAATFAASLSLASMVKPAFAHDYKIGDLSISHPWSRATPAGARVAGGYLRIENKGQAADRLVSVTFERAGRVEIHEMSVTDGVMRMRELPAGVPVTAGATGELKPGGLHIMFMELKVPLKLGERIRGSLTFERAGTVEVEFAVEATGAPSTNRHDH
ncbi:MAG: copper chaperone PCu(A)C [Beijerinckiaceae bacterium]